MDPLGEILAQVENLPTLPDVHVRIAELLDDPYCDPKEVARTLELDPVLAGRLIQMANSALFGGMARTDSVSSALMRLGARETRSLVLTSSILEAFDDVTGTVDLRDFWALGLASGLCCRQIAKDLGLLTVDQAYLAGLVHCLGEAVLAIYFPERFERALLKARAESCDLVETVWSEFGFTHPVLACRLLELWNFPNLIIEAVEYQLDPNEAPNGKLLAGVTLASDRICRELGFLSFDPGDSSRCWLGDIPGEFTRLLLGQGYDDLDSYVSSKKESLEEVQTLVNSVFSHR